LLPCINYQQMLAKVLQSSLSWLLLTWRNLAQSCDLCCWNPSPVTPHVCFCLGGFPRLSRIVGERCKGADSSSIFVARQRRDCKLITTCRTLLFQGSKLLHKWESLGVSRQGVHRGRSASTRYLMNVGEERRRRCIAIGRGFLLLAPFPIYASRVVTRPASSMGR